jgi:hypothetical protein
MATTSDIVTDRYGGPEGHQPLNKLVPAGVTVYRGTVAGMAGTGGAGVQGQLKNEDTVAATDIVLGIVSKAGSGYSNATVGITGAANVEIETGSFILASGTGADALSQLTNGATVYLINSTTVGATSGSASRPVAGIQLSCNADDASIPVGYVAVKLGTPNSPLGGP